jgi:hypothetical protein
VKSPSTNQIGLAELMLSKADLLLLNNALNEILNGVPIEDFALRIGTSREDASRLLVEIQSALGRM